MYLILGSYIAMLIPTVVLMSELLGGESPAKIIVKALFTTCN